MIELMPAFDPDNTEQALDLLAHFSGMSMAGFKQSDPTKELFHIINSLFSGEIETDKNGTLLLYSMGNNAFLLESHEMNRLEARPGENIHALADRANSIITSYVNANSHESQQVIDAVTDDLQELFLARLTQIVLCTSEGIQQNVHALVQKITDNGNISRAADIVASESEKWLPVLRDMVVISDAPNSGASNTTNAWNVQRSRRGTSTGEAKSSVLTTPQKIQKFGTALSKFCEGHDKDWILMHGSHAWSQCTRVAFEMRDAPKFVDSFRRFKKSCPPHLLSIFEELYARNSNRNRSDRNDNNGNYQNNNFGGTGGGGDGNSYNSRNNNNNNRNNNGDNGDRNRYNGERRIGGGGGNSFAARRNGGGNSDAPTNRGNTYANNSNSRRSNGNGGNNGNGGRNGNGGSNGNGRNGNNNG